MAKVKRELNYENLPVMSVGFVKSQNILGSIIRFFTHSQHVNHAFFITIDRGQKFATEETAYGLQEQSLEQYTTEKNLIVSVILFIGETDWKEKALDYLAEIRRKRLEESRYDFLGLLSFIPIIKLFFKPDEKKQWCSENVASILKKFGADFIDKTEISPQELYDLMIKSDDCIESFYFYKN